ncbi:MAG: polyprenyl synthetase family protein [Simkaniaceae bacterium]|nr:polyprenyl synthetase family protein [Simkaniaceae bacterium]
MKEQIEERLKELITSYISPLSPLKEGVEYILLSKGKRIRPLITLLLTENHPLALDVACAIELLHTSSLIHDDLPCMDDDDYRRGLLTLHKKYDEAHALLTGDLLMTWPYEIISSIQGLRDAQKYRLCLVLAKRFREVIEGQKLDLTQDNEGWKGIELMHEKKTAALFMAAFEAAAIINEHPLEDYSREGRRFGLAFQCYDDLLDQGPALTYFSEKDLKEHIEHLLSPVFCKFPHLDSLYPFFQEPLHV